MEDPAHSQNNVFCSCDLPLAVPRLFRTLPSRNSFPVPLSGLSLGFIFVPVNVNFSES